MLRKKGYKAGREKTKRKSSTSTRKTSNGKRKR